MDALEQRVAEIVEEARTRNFVYYKGRRDRMGRVILHFTDGKLRYTRSIPFRPPYGDDDVVIQGRIDSLVLNAPDMRPWHRVT
jgi:hypothetical protein